MWKWVVVLAACTHAGGGGSAGFSIAYPASTGKVGAKLYAQPAAQCRYDNGRDARWTITGARVASGELPPGVTIEDGNLTGTPTKAGSYHAHIEFTGATCAGKAISDAAVDVALTISAAK